MSDVIGWSIFLLLWVGAIVLLVYTRRRRARLRERLVELSQRKGWHLEAQPERLVDFILRGQQSGVDWEIRYATETQAAETGPTTATFRSEAVAFPGTVLVYPKSVQVQIDPKMGKVGELKGITGTLFNWSMKMVGLDVSESSFQEVGTRAFLDKYLLLAPDVDIARRLVGAIERDLLNWPATRIYRQLPMVVVNPDGVTVRVVREGTSLEHQLQLAERLVAIGVATVRAFK
jgi:hypothetical protein